MNKRIGKGHLINKTYLSEGIVIFKPLYLLIK